jgi:nucleoside-diphosphate kinase
MTGNITFTMIKPDAVKDNNIGPILAMINKAGFTITALKYMRLTKEQAARFYAVHKERPFFGELTEYMSNGPIVAAILQKNNAVAEYRKLIGATDPSKAEDGTVRKLFAKSIGENAVHGSDSDENASLESAFFFSQLERF